MSPSSPSPLAPISRRRTLASLALAGLMLVLAPSGCGERASARVEGPLRIVVSLAPLAGIVRALAPEGDVRVLVPAGASEHGYELTSGDVASVGRADLVVGVGLGLEPRLRALLSGMGDGAPASVWFERVLAESEVAGGDTDAHQHEHGAEQGAEHGAGHADAHEHGVDPHLWLDPALVDRFVPILAASIGRASVGTPSPIETAEMDRRVGALRARIATADARWRATLAPLQGRAIVTHHASHGRFAAHFGLRVAGVIRVSELQEPTPGQVQEMVARLGGEHVPAIFVEPQFDATTAARIAQAAGVRVVVLDPLGDGDWFGLMDSTVRTVAEALGAPAPGEDPPPARPGHDGASADGDGGAISDAPAHAHPTAEPPDR